MTYEFFAACPKGLESLLLEEIKSFEADHARETIAGVYFSGGHELGYRACLWSRLANKVLLPLATIELKDERSLYEGASKIPWDQHLLPTGTLSVDFLGTNKLIRNTQFGAVTIKDAIVDYFRERVQTRPSVQKHQPDLLINARLSKGRVIISLDLSGASLHQRGYRGEQGIAPLKENLAAAILLRAQWPHIVDKGGTIIDPMCGSATLLIEAAMMAGDIAPGLSRPYFGFLRWLQFDNNCWQKLKTEASERRQQGLQRLRDIAKTAMEFRGYDGDWRVLKAAEANIRAAGLEEFIRVSHKEVEELKRPTHKPLEYGLLICNPPYGERLGEVKTLEPVYRRLGELMKSEFAGWQAGIFTSNIELAKQLHIRAKKKYKLFNGTLETQLFAFDIDEKYFVTPKKLDPWGNSSSSVTEQTEPDSGSTPKPLSFEELTPGAQMVCNRLKKNAKNLRKWIGREKISCYRLYDADMPEYSAAIDIYGDYVHVQEYAAPKTVDEHKAMQRLDELMAAIPVALEVELSSIFLKQRRRNKGKAQYERIASDENRALIPVEEGSATLLVNLWSYLDTGLFLDHRPVRKMIAEQALGKRFLNLFCYTATATVHAALAGAQSSVSVDMSATYLRWAEQNFQTNHINSERHQLVQQDCVSWLSECRQGFDLILLDPPSFSNSKKLTDVFDVQRDHAKLITRCMEILAPNGVLIFSNNLRSFTLDAPIAERFSVVDITEDTLDLDFQRNRKIHRCYRITHI